VRVIGLLDQAMLDRIQTPTLGLERPQRRHQRGFFKIRKISAQQGIDRC